MVVVDAQVANVAVVMVRGWWVVMVVGRCLFDVLNSSTVQGMGSPILLEMKHQDGYLSWVHVKQDPRFFE